MKAERTHDYRIEGYGTVTFIKVDLGSGHSSFKVFWRKAGDEMELGLRGWQKAASRPRNWQSFTARWLAPKKTVSASTITMTKA
jgi:hypothetical protein